MKKLVLFLLCVSGISVLASGASSMAHSDQHVADQKEAFSAMRTMKCAIIGMKQPNLLILEDPKTGKRSLARLSKTVRLRAKDKDMFDGRKKLRFEDLSLGQEVKVSMNVQTGEVINLKVLSQRAPHLVTAQNTQTN